MKRPLLTIIFLVIVIALPAQALIHPNLPLEPPVQVAEDETAYQEVREYATISQNGFSFLISPINNRQYTTRHPIIVLAEYPAKWIIMEIWDVTDGKPEFYKDISFCYFPTSKYGIFSCPWVNLRLENSRTYQIRIYVRDPIFSKKILIIDQWFITTINDDVRYQPPPIDS